MPITFSREDHWVHIPDPRSYPLVVSPVIDRVLLSKVLIDGGSGLNIIFTETLKRVVLPITFSTLDNYRTEHLTFEIANFKTSYHAIFGRPMLARFMAIPNHTYLVMKMPAPKGVFPMFGDIETFYNCDIEVVQLVETLKYSINAIMMLIESKNIDQNQLKIPEIEPTPLALQPDQQVKKISLDLEDPSKTALIGARLFPK
ncbi:uncharacterized protein LOC106804539 [Setaria italica]|uniref:uncharacterized protein LOC106804539 n=1 Tax=Setaria italica TaxID=4555 RepID=UPI0007199E09|nr:uncharacterized protein LOC106804539 [Setaria italica]